MKTSMPADPMVPVPPRSPLSCKALRQKMVLQMTSTAKPLRTVLM